MEGQYLVVIDKFLIAPRQSGIFAPYASLVEYGSQNLLQQHSKIATAQDFSRSIHTLTDRNATVTVITKSSKLGKNTSSQGAKFKAEKK